MLLEALLIGSAGIINIGGIFFVKKRLQKLIMADDKLLENLEGDEQERWFTVGLVEHAGRYTDSKETYWINFALKASNRGQRKVDILTKGGSVHLSQHAVRIKEYLLYIQPWVEGTITLEDLARECPNSKLVPNKQLKNL